MCPDDGRVAARVDRGLWLAQELAVSQARSRTADAIDASGRTSTAVIESSAESTPATIAQPPGATATDVTWKDPSASGAPNVPPGPAHDHDSAALLSVGDDRRGPVRGRRDEWTLLSPATGCHGPPALLATSVRPALATTRSPAAAAQLTRGSGGDGGDEDVRARRVGQREQSDQEKDDAHDAAS